MAVFSTATTTSQSYPCPHKALSRKNLPENPAVGGSPTSENAATNSTKARPGAVRYSPSRSASVGFSPSWRTLQTT